MSSLLLGAGVGLGVLALLRGLSRPKVGLRQALAALERPRWDQRRDGTQTSGHLASTLGVGANPDLQIVGRSAEQQAIRKLAAAGILAVLPMVAATGAVLAGLDVGVGVAVLPAVALAAGGFVVPDLELRGLADERRKAFVHALSGYLDVTAVLLAGGAGTETALAAAARTADDWPHRMLRAALDRCRLTGRTPWSVFAELGDELAITELSQLAASLELAGAHGARVRATLAERAVGLRASQLSAVEARARAATEQMSVPVALLAVAFMLFVGFPAVWIVLGQL